MSSTPAGQPRRRLVAVAAVLSAVFLIPTAYAAVSSLQAKPPVTGTLFARHSDDFERGRASVDYAIKSDRGIVAVRVPRRAAEPLLGRRVQARFKVDGSAELTPVEGERSLLAASGAEAATSSARRVAILLVNFSNDTRQPWTREQVRAVAFDDPTKSVAAYYATSTWGRVTMSGDVFGWFNLPISSTSCPYSTIASSANTAAAAAGIDLNTYQHVVYAFPSTSGCGWSGLAYMPGKQSWLNGSGTNFRTMSHELGHNLGTDHASTLTCTVGGVRSPLASTDSSCTTSEYGDPFSVMGASQKHTQTNVARGNFGLLQSPNTLTVTSSGDYLLRPVDPSDPTGVQALRIARTTSRYLVLEYRQSDGSYFATYSSTDPLVNGVTVRVAAEYTTRTQTQLVDTTPSTTSFGDAPLAPGRTLTDPLTGRSVTTLSVGPEGALVRVSFGGGGAGTDTSAPTQPGGLSARALDSSRVALSWTASSDNVGVAGYRVLRNGTQVATVTATSWTDSGLAAGTSYAYQVVAFDAAGNSSPAASASATTPSAPPADTQAPTAPAGLTGSVAKKKVSLSWGASSDNVGVAGYRVFRDGKQVAQTAGTSYTDTLAGKSPTATYYVVAYDAAGNVSAASSSISVSG